MKIISTHIGRSTQIIRNGMETSTGIHTYSHLDWNWGIFRENLSVEGLDETQI